VQYLTVQVAELDIIAIYDPDLANTCNSQIG
jgi:hypothetical protein